jgi:hypothetical protein
MNELPFEIISQVSETAKRILQRLRGCNFIDIKYRKGECATYSLALAFNTSLWEMQQLMRVVCMTPKQGVTIDEIKEAIKYCEAIYHRPTCKVEWRGKLFDFVNKYQEGIWLVNCEGHLSIVFNGVIFGSNLKNYNVYNVWQIRNVLHPIVEASESQVSVNVLSVDNEPTEQSTQDTQRIIKRSITLK